MAGLSRERNMLARGAGVALLALSVLAIFSPLLAEENDICDDAFDTRRLSEMAIRPSASDAQIDPALRALAVNALMSYSCQEFINHYSRLIGARDDEIKNETVDRNDANVLVFRNAVYGNVCGSIEFVVPQPLKNGASPVERNFYKELAKTARLEFMTATAELSVIAKKQSQHYLLNSLSLAKPGSMSFDYVIIEYAKKLIGRYQQLLKENNWGERELSELSGRARCAPLLPKASGPNFEAVRNYSHAARDLARFRADLGVD